jgi:two-component sensor histidine kinase
MGSNGRGFGHRLVAQCAAQLGGRAEFAWEPGGLCVTLWLPRNRLAQIAAV